MGQAVVMHAYVKDVLLRSRVDGLARAAGFEPRFFATPASLLEAEQADLAVIDLSDRAGEGMELLSRLGGTPVLAFYAHTDDATRKRALELGASRVVPRSTLMKRFEELVKEILAG